jgi:hypothetical protein
VVLIEIDCDPASTLRAAPAESTSESDTLTAPVDETVTVVAALVVTSKRTTDLEVVMVESKDQTLEAAHDTGETEVVPEWLTVVVPPAATESSLLIFTAVIVVALAGTATRPVSASAAATATAISFLDI